MAAYVNFAIWQPSCNNAVFHQKTHRSCSTRVLIFTPECNRKASSTFDTSIGKCADHLMDPAPERLRLTM